MTEFVIMGASPFLRYLWEHMLVRRYGSNTIKLHCYRIKSFIRFIARFIWCESNEVNALNVALSIFPISIRENERTKGPSSRNHIG